MNQEQMDEVRRAIAAKFSSGELDPDQGDVVLVEIDGEPFALTVEPL